MQAKRGRFADFDLQQRQNGVASVFSTLILEALSSLINVSLGTFLLGLAIYFDFLWTLWTQSLGIIAGENDSRSVFIIFIIAVISCSHIYSIPQITKSRSKRILELNRWIQVLIDAAQENPPSMLKSRLPSVKPRQRQFLCNSTRGKALGTRRQLAPIFSANFSSASVHTPSAAFEGIMRRAIQTHREEVEAEINLIEQYAKILKSIGRSTNK